MADAVSDKEKAAAKDEEKDRDTTSKSPKNASPKPGSGKSKPGSGRSSSPTGKAGTKSPKSSTRVGSPTGGKPAKGKSKGKKAKHEEEKPQETPVSDDTAQIEEGGLPEGVVPIFFASKTQEIFEVKADEDVTAESPFKMLKKEDIINDMRNRAAVSDFHPVKQLILDYPVEEILVGYDADYKYGQNFFIAITEEGKAMLLKMPIQRTKRRRIKYQPGNLMRSFMQLKFKIRRPDQEDGPEEEGEDEMEAVIYKYVPPQAKEWVSQGSEKEISEEALVESRPRIQFSAKRLRRDFGAPCSFSDRNVADAKDGYIECVPYEDKTFDLTKSELEKGVQAIPDYLSKGCQTDWKHPRNAASHYAPREFTEEEKKKQLAAPNLQKFADRVTPRFELALQQNEIMDVFFDDWQALGDDDGSFGSKADNHLKEYQSFTDLKFSKEKTISCIDWHPTIKGIIATAVGEKLTFDDRVDLAHKIIMSPSLILIWSFADPIHPQLLLEAPDDITFFRFCPTDPNIIAGGCLNGQIVLWDISGYVDRLKAQKSSKRPKKNTMNSLPGFEDESAMDTPIIRYCAVSGIEHGHKESITDLLWVPDHMELNRMGVPSENYTHQCTQILTCATDHCVLLWDTKPPKGHQVEEHDKSLTGVPNTFKHLDLTWKPLLKVSINKSEPGGDFSPTKFTIQETQGDRSVLSRTSDIKTEKESSTAGGFSFGGGKPGSAVEKKTLNNVKTQFYVGTEDGELVYVDWMPQKDSDSGKIQTPKPEFYMSCHDGPITSLQRSPFFKDIVLCVGGWNFAIWKEGIDTGPILTSTASTKRLTEGRWSPSRPGVFYIGCEDGSIDIWDLLDRTHEPSINQNVSTMKITQIFPWQVTSKQHLLAVGDHAGTLHILEIPWSLRQPTSNEYQGVSNYFEREVKRRNFVVDRWNFREQEKRELELEAKRKAGIAPNVMLTDDEIDYRLKSEYAQYEEAEQAFLRQMGLKEDEDEPMPEM